MYNTRLDFSEGPDIVELNLFNHDRDWLYLAKDLGIPLSIEEFDNLSRRRIFRLTTIQERKLQEMKNHQDDMTKKEKAKQEAEARRQARTVK